MNISNWNIWNMWKDVKKHPACYFDIGVKIYDITLFEIGYEDGKYILGICGFVFNYKQYEGVYLDWNEWTIFLRRGPIYLDICFQIWDIPIFDMFSSSGGSFFVSLFGFTLIGTIK